MSCRRRRQSGPDRPDRFVGDDEVLASSSGSEPSSCAPDDMRRRRPASRSARVSPTQMIGSEPGAARRQRLGAHHRIGFAVIMPPLGMADDHGLRAGVAQHFGGDIAGIGAGRLRRGNPGRRSRPAMPVRRAAKLAISVAGGHTMTSTVAADSRAPATIFSNSPIEAQARSFSNCRRPADDAPCIGQCLIDLNPATNSR